MASDELPTEHYLLDCFPHYTCIMRDMEDGDDGGGGGGGDDDGGDDGVNGGDDDGDGVVVDGIKVVGDFSNEHYRKDKKQ